MRYFGMIFFVKGSWCRSLHTLGDWDSPVIPIMMYCPTKMPAFSRECLEEGLAVVVVGFPATPLFLSRARVCISAAHTREDLEYAIKKIDAISDKLRMKWGRSAFG